MTVTTIAATELNFRVRNENGCDPGAKPPKHTLQYLFVSFSLFLKLTNQVKTKNIDLQIIAALKPLVPSIEDGNLIY